MMLTEMINFDCDNFKVDDAEVDHEDKILKRELNQLISEQLGNFDLSEEEDQPDEICIVQTKPGCSPPETVAASSDDLISIIEAGKLSLLEIAIQKFGECSENATTESNELTSLGYDGQQSNSNRNSLGLSGRCSQDTHVVRQFENSAKESEKSTNCNNIHQVSNIHVCDNVQNPQLPIFPSVVSQDKPLPKVLNAAPCINLDLSLPGEVTNTLFSTAVDNKNQYTTHDHGRVISGPTNSIQTPPSPWSLLPSAIPPSLPPPDFPENVAWSRNSKGPTPSHAAYNEVTQASIPVDIKTHIVGHTTTSELTSSNIPCVTSSANMNLDSHLLPSGNEDRRELLYTARGRQLQELQAEVVQLKEEIAKEKRLSNHRILLAEGEKEILRSNLSTLEDTVKSLRMELVTKKENAEVLQNQLQENAESQKKLNEELLALRTTNESLSCQLVELTTGNALKRAEERETQLAESLEQRFLSRTEEIKTELKATQRNLNEKENEVSDLRRQLEICKAETMKAQQTHAEMIKEANKQLEEAQKHCQQLASSALCSEVTSLRQKVIELETSRKITEDVNTILQDELRGFRDQVAIYENVLKLDVYSHNVDIEDPVMYEPNDLTPYANKGRHSGKSVAFADVDTPGPSKANPLHRRPSSAIERPIYHQAFDENLGISTRCHSDEQSSRTRQHSGGKQAFSDNEDMLGKLGECDKVSFHSLTRQGILTSTPAVTSSKSSPKSPMGRLRAELERCLLNYKAKREQITKLHEALYTTRCQLHQSRESTEKAEKSAKLLQERVVSMEHELSTLRGIGENPGPREVLLSGQLERLKGDYVRLEEELQATRTRLQAALGAEAKALEAEKAASERLAASVAERDAAVDRARAVCESHYTAMRRRLEVDWANDKEAYARRAEEKLADMRKELYGMQQEVQRITNLYQESQVSAKKAIENALLEAMKLREAERMKFWREELPEQIEVARQSWISEMKGQHTSVNPSHKSVQTEPSADNSHASQSSVHVQTSLCDLLSIKLGLNLSDNSTFDNTEALEIKSILLNKYPILSQFMSMECLHYLCTHLIETPCMHLLYLEKEISNSFHTLLEIRLQNFLKQVNNELKKLIDEYKVTHIFNENVNKTVLSDDAVILKYFDPLQSVSVIREPEKTTAECIAHNLSVKTSDNQLSNTISSEYQSLITKIRVLTSSVSKSSECAPPSDLHNSLSTYEHKFVQVSDLEAPYYYSILEKIKGDVLKYVELCQSRAAQTLHTELFRIHKRACRQFTCQLRKALLDAGAPPVSSTTWHTRLNKTTNVPQEVNSNHSKCIPHDISCNSQNSKLKEPESVIIPPMSNSCTDLESLLHIIDEVCSTTESKFYTETTTGSRLFNRSTTESESYSRHNSQHRCEQQSRVDNIGDLASASYNPNEPKRAHSELSSMHNYFSNVNSPQQLSVTNASVEITSQIKGNNTSLSPKNMSNVHSNHLCRREEDFTSERHSGEQIKFYDRNVSRPIPTPRLSRSNFDSNNNNNPLKLSKSPNLLQSTPINSLQNANCDRKPVHTELYKLFENFYNTSSKHADEQNK